MPEAHSEWSASGFKRIMLCPGSKVLERGAADRSTIYAAEGTAAHELLEMVLTGGTPAAGFVGRVIKVDEEDRSYEIEVTDDMARYVQGVVDFVLELKGADGVLMVEQQLCYADYLDVDRDKGWGTGDVVIAKGNRLIVIDLKYGKGVEVDVEENPQLMLYGLGALDKLNGIAGDFEEVELIIAQPRITPNPSRWETTVEHLETWGRSTARSAVASAKNAEQMAGSGPEWNDVYVRPGEEQCRFCKGKATCPKLRAEVALHVSSSPAASDEFEQISDPKTFSEPDLARAMSAAKMIEEWVKSVRSEVERRLLAGTPVPGYKLVEGKLGNRAWTNKAEVEEAMKSMRLKQDEMYDMSIISPTTAEKLLAKNSPRRWTKLQQYITRTPGEPSVAPLSDKRPALEMKPVADDFDAVDTIDDLA
jgi:hypothetical protein